MTESLNQQRSDSEHNRGQTKRYERTDGTLGSPDFGVAILAVHDHSAQGTFLCWIYWAGVASAMRLGWGARAAVSGGDEVADGDDEEAERGLTTRMSRDGGRGIALNLTATMFALLVVGSIR